MPNPVQFFFFFGVLVPADGSVQIIVDGCTSYNAGLGAPGIGQGVEIIAGLGIFDKLPGREHFLEGVPGALVNLLGIYVRVIRKLSLGPVYFKKERGFCLTISLASARL